MERLILANMGVIVRSVAQNYFKLPVYVRSFYDFDDMVSEVVTAVVQFGGTYDPARSKAVTFVAMVSQTQCLKIVSHYFREKRMVKDIPYKSREIQRFDEQLEAIDNVQSVIMQVSQPVRFQLLQSLAGGTKLNSKAAKEVREVAQRNGATFEQFRVLQNVITAN